MSSAGVLLEEDTGAPHHLVRRQDGGDVDISVDSKHFRPNRPFGGTNEYNNGYGYNNGYNNGGYNNGGYNNGGYNNGYNNGGYNNGYGNNGYGYNNGYNNGYNGYNNGYGGGRPFGFRSANEDGAQNSVQD